MLAPRATFEQTCDCSIVKTAQRNAAHARALVTPARQEIVDVLEAAGPSSVARLAELIGRPADALYHHLRRLERVGLVTAERRQEGRHVFAVYDLVRRPLLLARDGADTVAVMGAAQRQAWRDFRRALAGGADVSDGPRRTLRGSRSRGWLAPAQLARVNALLTELCDTLRAGEPGPGRVPVSLTFLLAPAPPRRRSSRKGKSP
jgi:DNA-binding transcriptional ArsR family regulator